MGESLEEFVEESLEEFKAIQEILAKKGYTEPISGRFAIHIWKEWQKRKRISAESSEHSI